MALLITLLADGSLFFGTFASVFLATCWGELCGIRPGGDKSGLGGFMATYLFMMMRWPAILLGFWLGANRGGLDGLPIDADQVFWIGLGLHAALGALSLWAFGKLLTFVQNDRFAPAWCGWLCGVALPLPVATAAIVAANRGWLGDGLVPAAIVLAVLLALHWLPFRARLNDMRRPRRAPEWDPNQPGPTERQ
jgi:hypothetical protein